MTNTSTNTSIALHQGAQLIIQQFHPKHRLSVNDVCPVLGLSRDGFYKRLRMGKLSLKIRKDEYGKLFVLLSDLISYFYPEVVEFDSSVTAITAMPSGIEKRKVGRPRGSKNKTKSAPQAVKEGGAK